MNKEEIIKIASESKSDEREVQVTRRSYQIGAISISVAMMVLMILRWLNDDLFFQDLLFIMMTQATTLAVYQYIKLKNTLNLVMSIIGGFAVIFSLINVLTNYGFIG